MAVDLELRYRGLRAPHKIKLGVSGCERECAEARSKDVGVIATEKGWNLYVGGNGGMTPKHAQLLAADLDDATLVRYIDRYLMYYIRTADRLQRTALWQDHRGRSGSHSRGRHRRLTGYRRRTRGRDGAPRGRLPVEWTAVLADQDKLARFVSFVNAPGPPDPNRRVRREDGRKVPVMLGTPEVRKR